MKMKLVCEAFPVEGIPMEIGYGDNLHLDPFPGDHGIRFEKGGGRVEEENLEG
jgi:hypothetical protein